ncbi:uncharacterized protein LOC113849613 [Abrus precatorius]|uniref:Uncharacterized protein LOC113849613 n=1 Tax=Abrus precatorius TaxID=3816 RepID=A0A8B8JVS3_ABRPR|nr:uncharacterized protein LOC113849613 [Abrus precatorius]XP_027335434.1 uncharacterized protein LOC113849613 [Abrus precatorius]
MGPKVLQLSQPVLPHSPSSQTLASAISSPSSKPRTRNHNGVCRFAHRSSLFPNTHLLRRSKSFDHYPVFTRRGSIRRACSASLEPFSDEEFAKKIEDLALKFQLSDDSNGNDLDSEVFPSSGEELSSSSSAVNFVEEFEPPEEIIPANIERKANSVELPFSLRIIKKKLQWKEGFREAGESAYCSVKKAFSSMVFIISELHSYTLQMREILFYEDLQGILQRVQREMHASFVWLFQQVFSHTPTLMVYVMILLANFTVHSMGHNAAIAAVTPPVEVSSVVEGQDWESHKFDSAVIKTFSVSNSNGKNTASVGGGNGGGGKFRPAANGTDGDGRFDGSDRSPHATVFPDGGASSQVCKTGETESVSGQEEEEAKLWKSMVDEASIMEVNRRGEGLDRDVMKGFVSPVMARIESDDYAEYLRTELVYQTGLSQDPRNTLLLANYAQFLYLVAHDYDRAEEYFKRAIEVEPPDAEAYNKYATFLWKVKNDLWAAEETYLEAISAEPNNSYYAANYAHFLWNTGGEDTCFPLSSPDNSQEL